MRNSVINIIDILLGAFLLGLGLLYLLSQYTALSRLTDIISLQTIEDNNVYQQFNLTTIDQVYDEEVYATIMGYREHPIIVDGHVIPINGHDYELYFTYLKDGYYKKEYEYEVGRHIVMIQYTYIGT